MLTPGFELSQTVDFLIVSIQIPYAKISEIEVHFEDTDFMFYSKPYYLRLNLPGKVQFSENPDVNYNIDKKILTVKALKAVKGQVFDGLDLITKLLTQKKITSASPMIEVIDDFDTNHELHSTDENDELDWSIEQNPSDDFCKISLLGDQCGFANSYSFAVFKLKEETEEIFDARDPEKKPPSLRREERVKAEADHFDEDHYVADLYHDDTIQELLKYKPEWEDLYDKVQSSESAACDDKICFTPEEKEKLRKLPKKEYVLDKSQVKVAFLSLVDILFAFAYNKRTTEGENTVESAWTINKISATLSWLETFSSVPDVAWSSIRRSLSYPLYRHFELSVTILEDVRKILLLGRKYVIKCLLEIHDLFSFSEPRYILNDLYVTDYCVWMQTKRCESSKLIPLANALEKILLTKGDIGFNLVDIESFAAVAWMAHNPDSSFSLKDKKTNKKNEKSQSDKTHADALCLNMENLTIHYATADGCCADTATMKPSNRGDPDFTFSEYESCSSYTPSSSCSSNSEDSSNSDFDTESSSDSDEDTDTSSETEDHEHLSKLENDEKNR